MNFSSWAYKSFTRKLSRTKIIVQLSHSCDVTTACLGLEATATWVRRNASSARPSGTNSLHQPDVRPTTISYNVNHLPWPKLKSYNTSSYKCVTGNAGLLSQWGVHDCTRPSAPAVGTWGPLHQPEGPRSDTAGLSLLLSECHVPCPQNYKRSSPWMVHVSPMSTAQHRPGMGLSRSAQPQLCGTQPGLGSESVSSARHVTSLARVCKVLVTQRCSDSRSAPGPRLPSPSLTRHSTSLPRERK